MSAAKQKIKTCFRNIHYNLLLKSDVIIIVIFKCTVTS